MRRYVFPYKAVHLICHVPAQTFHVFAIAVDRLYGTADPVGDIFHQHLLHTAVPRNLKSRIDNHFLCDPLFWHWILLYINSLYKSIIIVFLLFVK